MKLNVIQYKWEAGKIIVGQQILAWETKCLSGKFPSIPTRFGSITNHDFLMWIHALETLISKLSIFSTNEETIFSNCSVGMLIMQCNSLINIFEADHGSWIQIFHDYPGCKKSITFQLSSSNL
jgi:hypothetical protein